MYHLYTHSTPNPYKVSIALEELGLPYTFQNLHFSESEQKSPAFLKINPNGKVPVLVDREADDFTLVESGAILLYLAEKHQALLPKEAMARSETIQWLMWQMSGLGPMFGQFMVFAVPFENRIPEATQRYQKELVRLLHLLDQRLQDRTYLAANEHTIADIAVWPWIRLLERTPIALSDFPHIQSWFQRLAQRPAYIQGVDKLGDEPEKVKMQGFFKATIGIGS